MESSGYHKRSYSRSGMVSSPEKNKNENNNNNNKNTKSSYSELSIEDDLDLNISPFDEKPVRESQRFVIGNEYFTFAKLSYVNLFVCV